MAKTTNTNARRLRSSDDGKNKTDDICKQHKEDFTKKGISKKRTNNELCEAMSVVKKLKAGNHKLKVEKIEVTEDNKTQKNIENLKVSKEIKKSINEKSDISHNGTAITAKAKKRKLVTEKNCENELPGTRIKKSNTESKSIPKSLKQPGRNATCSKKNSISEDSSDVHKVKAVKSTQVKTKAAKAELGLNNVTEQITPSRKNLKSISKTAKTNTKAFVGAKKIKPESHTHVNIVSGGQPRTIDVSDPMAMLMMMEGQKNPQPSTSRMSLTAGESSASTSYHTEESEEDNEATFHTDSEAEGMSDWEEVHNHTIDTERSQIPDKPVEITLELPDILKHKKKKKKAFDWKAYLVRRVKRFKKEVAMDMHKVHLLCLLSLGLRQNEVLNEPELKAVVLSLLPAQFSLKLKSSIEMKVENLLSWYKRKFPLDKITHCSDIRLVTLTSFVTIIAKETITDARVWVLVFICILRTIGLTVRLVLSLQPIPFRSESSNDDEKNTGKLKLQKSGKLKKEKSSLKTVATKTKEVKKPKPKKADSAPGRRLSSRESSKNATLKTRKSLKEFDVGDDSDGNEDDSDGDAKSKKVSNSDSELSAGGLKKGAKSKKSRAKKDTTRDESSSENDFEETSFYFQSPRHRRKDLKILSNRKILSESSSDDAPARSRSEAPGHDFWLEIYFPEKQKWICFDCFKSQFGKPYSLENSATQPLTYVLGFKNDNSIKDVTARYAKQWLSHTRKLRTDPEWWNQTVFIFDSTPFKENLLEDDDIKSHLLVRPMPTSIAEFKNHPLYALQRHLLKFEAIYPETAIPLGYIKKEPIYARECVRTLHSRINWLKEGRMVRLNETPYKMVKSRPKWNKPKENPNELDLELYGEWQTEKYIPPPAHNGKVPKNEYGNVELFKPWMLPKGTVQLRGQGMQRVAKKLNIDIAAAMIGWDYHSGSCHAVMDGWIVCEEHADTLMTAWLEDQEHQEQREKEKKEKRVYDNWRLLIRGLLIRERLKSKFLQDAPLLENAEETFSDAEVACDVQSSWPRNRQDVKTEDKAALKQELLEKKLKQFLEAKASKFLEKKPTTKSRSAGSAKSKKSSGCKKPQKNIHAEETDEDAFESVTDKKAGAKNSKNVKKKGVAQKVEKLDASGEVKKEHDETSSGESESNYPVTGSGMGKKNIAHGLSGKGSNVDKSNVKITKQIRSVKGRKIQKEAIQTESDESDSDAYEFETKQVKNKNNSKSKSEQGRPARSRPSIGRTAKAKIKNFAEDNESSSASEPDSDESD